jgi:tRNA threonylcarbamoyl adenosine modification protein (Sua5/YciO/YrdC/YwlC family)
MLARANRFPALVRYGPSMPPIRLSCRGSDRPRALLAAVDRLRRGGLCALPTETVYGLGLLPAQADSEARARTVLQRDAARPFVLHVADRAAAMAQWPTTPPHVVRLLDRYWPGPLTVIQPSHTGLDVAVRLPAHEFTRSVIAACGEPLWLAALQRPAAAACTDADTIVRDFPELDLVLDDGRSPLGTPSTVVRRQGTRLDVLREGILSRAEVLHTAAATVLFVCTGNTCRSPLAELLARELTAQQLQVPRDEVLAHGYRFVSAGTAALDGEPASDGSCGAAAELGLDLTAHRSTALTPALARQAEHIYCLAQSHRRALLAEVPDVAAKVHLLRPDRLDIADPYGAELPRYRRARDEVRAAIAVRLRDWLPH